MTSTFLRVSWPNHATIWLDITPPQLPRPFWFALVFTGSPNKEQPSLSASDAPMWSSSRTKAWPPISPSSAVSRRLKIFKVWITPRGHWAPSCEVISSQERRQSSASFTGGRHSGITRTRRWLRSTKTDLQQALLQYKWSGPWHIHPHWARLWPSLYRYPGHHLVDSHGRSCLWRETRLLRPCTRLDPKRLDAKLMFGKEYKHDDHHVKVEILHWRGWTCHISGSGVGFPCLQWICFGCLPDNLLC